MEIEKWSSGREREALDFLEKYKETSMFLLTNFVEQGPYCGEHQNSGNFYLISQFNRICGVFCLPRRGNLLIQVEKQVDPRLILDFLKQNENIKIKGVLGENTVAFDTWNKIKILYPEVVESFSSKEILYHMDLKTKDTYDLKNIRFFEIYEFDIYYEYIQNFNTDQNLPRLSDPDKIRARYEYLVENKLLWALIKDGEIASMAAINAKYNSTVQVGGVYTINKFRSQGFSKKCINKLMHDCKLLHNCETIILFTGQSNIPAQKVYQSVGFNRIGYYGMYFGSIE